MQAYSFLIFKNVSKPPAIFLQPVPLGLSHSGPDSSDSISLSLLCRVTPPRPSGLVCLWEAQQQQQQQRASKSLSTLGLFFCSLGPF